MTRVVPLPTTISPEAQAFLRRTEPDQAPPEPLAQRRSRTDTWAAGARVAWSKLCPNQLVEDKIAGVPVRIVTPDGLPEANKDKVLLNLHGGGFDSDSGSLHRNDSDCRLCQNQGRGGALPAGSRASLPRRRRRTQ